MNVFKLSECVLSGMLFGVNFDTIRTHGEETRLVFAEIDDKLFGMKGAVGWLHGENWVNGKRNYNRKISMSGTY